MNKYLKLFVQWAATIFLLISFASSGVGQAAVMERDDAVRLLEAQLQTAVHEHEPLDVIVLVEEMEIELVGGTNHVLAGVENALDCGHMHADEFIFDPDVGSSGSQCRFHWLKQIWIPGEAMLSAGVRDGLLPLSIPQFMMIALLDRDPGESLVLVHTDWSVLTLSDALTALVTRLGDQYSDTPAADSAFLFHSQRWDEPKSWEEILVLKASTTMEEEGAGWPEPDLQESESSAPSFLNWIDFECDDSSDPAGGSERWRTCNNCPSGGSGAIACSCPNADGATCQVMCSPSTHYACCRCHGLMVPMCRCCSGSGGGGGGSWWPGSGFPIIILPPPEPDPGDPDPPDDPN